MAALRNGYVSPPAGTERKMAGLRLLQPGSHGYHPLPSRADELSELSGLMAEQEEERDEEERDTDGEYDMVQKEEAAEMPPNFPRSFVCRSYGTLSPSSRRRRRKRKNSWRRRSGAFSPVLPPSHPHHHPHHPYFSLSPQRMRQESSEAEQRAWGSTSVIPQVCAVLVCVYQSPEGTKLFCCIFLH